MMAIAPPNHLLARLTKALGLEHCRSFTFRASVGNCVMLESEHYVQESTLEKFAGEIETKEWVLVPKAEWVEMQVSLAREKESRT